MPPCKRRGGAQRIALPTSPNEYRSTDAPIVPFMTCAPFCASGFRDNGRKVHERFKPHAEIRRLGSQLRAVYRRPGDASVSDARALLRTDDQRRGTSGAAVLPGHKPRTNSTFQGRAID